jgi:hypothetical protein
VSDIRVVLLVLALVPGRGLAQSPELEPPPLVEASSEEVEAEDAPVPEAALPSRAVAEAQGNPQPAGRVMGRVLLEVMTGGLSGVAGIATGAFLSQASLICAGDCSGELDLVGGVLIGWSMGAALGVYGGGALADGRGGFLPTMGVGLLTGGAATGLYAMNALDDVSAVPLFMGLSLVGSILTYEMTSARASPGRHAPTDDSRSTGASWTPSVQLSPRGGALGLTGRF